MDDDVKITVHDYADFLEYFGQRYYNDIEDGFELIVQHIFDEGLTRFMDDHWKEYREWVQ